MIKEIAFTVYAVTDIGRARAFYEGVLKLVPNGAISENVPWIEYDIGGNTLAIGSSPDWKPSQDGASVALEVEDFDASIKTLKEEHIVFTLEAQDFPSCRMAVIEDPDRNKIIIHQRKSK